MRHPFTFAHKLLLFLMKKDPVVVNELLESLMASAKGKKRWIRRKECGLAGLKMITQ